MISIISIYFFISANLKELLKFCQAPLLGDHFQALLFRYFLISSLGFPSKYISIRLFSSESIILMLFISNSLFALPSSILLYFFSKFSIILCILCLDVKSPVSFIAISFTTFKFSRLIFA